MGHRSLLASGESLDAFSPTLYPYHVRLLRGPADGSLGPEPASPYASFCGGALIRSDFVLTAASCAFLVNETSGLSVPRLQAWVTIAHPTNKSVAAVANPCAQVIAGAFFAHPEYNASSGRNDVALLRLDRSAACALPASTNYTPSLVLPLDNASFAADDAVGLSGVSGRLSGFGELYGTVGYAAETIGEWYWSGRAAVQYPSTLQYTSDQQIVTDANCANREDGTGQLVAPSYLYSPLAQLCAVSTNAGRSGCASDAGGPLVVARSGVSVLVGVFSYAQNGSACGGSPTPYNYYARVAAFTPWIEAYVNGPPPPPPGLPPPSTPPSPPRLPLPPAAPGGRHNREAESAVFTQRGLSFMVTFFIAIASFLAIILVFAAVWPCMRELFRKRKLKARVRRAKRHGMALPVV